MDLSLEPRVRQDGDLTVGSGASFLSHSFVQRLAVVALLILAEWVPISVFIHTRRGGQSAARGVVAFISIFLAFGYLRNKQFVRNISSQLTGFQISGPYLALHACTMVGFLFLSLLPAAGGPGLGAIFFTSAWYVTGAAGILTAGLILLPARIWRSLFQSTGPVWMFALGGGLAAWSSVKVSWSLWNNSSVRFVSDITFRMVELLLRPFLADMAVDRAQMMIGTPRFTVQIGDACSGLEGIGLIVVFSVIWLVLFRSECRFPRALLVIPGGIAIVFLLNAVRIASLILIGNAGAPEIALGGFHSQAGWIGFNLVALGCSFAVPRISWLSTRNPASRRQLEANPAVPWLLPFALVLGAGMISRAASAGFEWLYPIRICAAVAGLWICRRSQAYRNLIPRFWWDSFAAGVVVFVIWVALDRVPHEDNGISAGLAAMPVVPRAVWLLFRVLGAVITVPVVEELAFRGFLLRRLVARDFESVNFRRFTWVALIASSLAFGLMHGDRWLAGSVAGMIYAIVMIRRGHPGSAILAHATTNAMLAAWVLITGNWQFW